MTGMRTFVCEFFSIRSISLLQYASELAVDDIRPLLI